jgi:DHA1 family multidrug resistance protein-like MFS transporter
LDDSIKKLMPVYMLVFLRALGLALSVNGPMMPLYVRSLGISVTQWGVLSTLFAVGLVSFEAFWGTMSDRINRIWLLIIALVFMGSVLPLYTFEGLLPYFGLFQFLMGSFMVMVGPTTRALIADHSPVRQMGFNMSLWSTCVSIGGILGPVLGGYLAQNMGYRVLFYVSSGILIANALLLLVTGRSLRTDERSKTKIKIWANIKVILHDPQMRFSFTIAFLIFFGLSSIRSFLPIYASEFFNMDDVSVGLMTTIGTALMLLLTPLMGALSDRISVKRLLISLLSVSGILFLLIQFASTPLHITLLAIGLIISYSSQSISLIMLSKLAAKNKIGITMGIYGSFEDMGLIIGPLLFGYIWESFGAKNIYIVTAASAFLAITLLLVTRIEPKQ